MLRSKIIKERSTLRSSTLELQVVSSDSCTDKRLEFTSITSAEKSDILLPL